MTAQKHRDALYYIIILLYCRLVQQSGARGLCPRNVDLLFLWLTLGRFLQKSPTRVSEFQG
jgi:hypothetical protein